MIRRGRSAEDPCMKNKSGNLKMGLSERKGYMVLDSHVILLNESDVCDDEGLEGVW